MRPLPCSPEIVGGPGQKARQDVPARQKPGSGRRSLQHTNTLKGTGRRPVLLLLLLWAGSLGRAIPEQRQDCPGFGTDADEEFCPLWQESVASIPYEIPWTEENSELLKDSIMQHCILPGVVAGRPCCAFFPEWSCVAFSRHRAQHHRRILHAMMPPLSPPHATASELKQPRSPPPVLLLTVGVPGTGKSAALRDLADVLMDPVSSPSSLPLSARVGMGCVEAKCNSEESGEREALRRISEDEDVIGAHKNTQTSYQQQAGDDIERRSKGGETLLEMARAIRHSAAEAGVVWRDAEMSERGQGKRREGEDEVTWKSRMREGARQHRCQVACDDLKTLLAEVRSLCHCVAATNRGNTHW